MICTYIPNHTHKYLGVAASNHDHAWTLRLMQGQQWTQNSININYCLAYLQHFYPMFASRSQSLSKTKLKSTKISYSHMAILYRTAKFKSYNTFEMAIWNPTAKFNSCQYFQLCSILHCGKVLARSRCSTLPCPFSACAYDIGKDHEESMCLTSNVHLLSGCA